MEKIFIDCIEDLEILRECKGGEYLVSLERDLDFEDSSSYRFISTYINYMFKQNYEPIVLDDVMVIFDGNGHYIKNVTIDMPNSDDIGFFNTKNNSLITIKELNFRAKVTGRNNVGLIGGQFNGTVNDSYICGTVIGENAVGGIVGTSDKELYFNFVYIDVSLKSKGMHGIVAGRCNKEVIRSCELNACNESGREINDYNGLCENLEITHHKRALIHRFLK